MAITKEEFKDALSCFASGVTVVTTIDNDGELHGLTVSAFCSVSLDPPLVLICIDKGTGSYHAFEENGNFVVNFLNENQQNVSNQFASSVEDKFDGIRHTLNEYDIPVLSDSLVNLECKLKNAYDGGDHTIFIGEIFKSKVRKGKPLVYCHGKYQELD